MGEKTATRWASALVALVAALAVAAAMAAGAPQQLQAAEGDIASGTWGSCPWEISADGVLTIHPGTGEDTGRTCPWKEYEANVRRVVCAEEGGSRVVAPADCSNLFVLGEYYAGSFDSTVESFDLSGLDTSKTEDMFGMFYGCSSLASLDLSGLDTSNATDMSFMFSFCSSLTSLDVSCLDTSNVTSMVMMFYKSPSLSSLDLSGLDTSKVTDMSFMFSDCSSLSSLDVSSFDTSNATGMGGMFSDCSSLGRLATGAGWAQASVSPSWNAQKATFPVPMADEAGSVYRAYDVIPDGAHVYTAHAAPAEVAVDSVELTQASFAYDGRVQRPSVASVRAGGAALAAGDYEVSYSDAASKDAGSYAVTVTAQEGSGFTGSASAAYEIKPAAVTAIALSRASSAYTGKAQKPAIASVKAGSLVLMPSDYSVTYQDSKGRAIKASAIKAAGTYRVVVTGKGNFTGSKSATFKVAPAKNVVAVAKASVKKSLKASALKKKAASVSLPKATAEFGSAKWKVAAKDKKNVLSLSGGKVKVKKGAKRGTYTIKLKASVAKTANYGAASSKAVTVKVTVK